MRYEVGDVHEVHYAEVATALGAARLGAAIADPEPARMVAGRWERARDIPNSANHVDANAVGIWPMLAAGGDEAMLARGIALADGQWDDVDETGLTRQARFWIDDVWMIGALQAQAWRATRAPRFLDRAALTAQRYLARLQQPNGLFHHGPEAPFFWGRGNGWVAAGLAEILSELPRDHAEHGAVLDGYRTMMQALLAWQAPGGMWRQLIDRPDAWEETSGTAMFGYAMLRGANEGWLEDPAFREAGLRAWDALTEFVESDGRVRQVCVGTGQSDEAQYYLDRPTVTGDLHGQAPLLWLAAEVLRR